MKKIGDITNTADKNGEFTDGNVAAGIPPTQLMGAWFNSVQREILNVLSKADIPQSATKENQLADAIIKIIANYSQPKGNYQQLGYGYSKAESDAKYQQKGNYAFAENYANKGDSYTKLESNERYQAKGNYAPVGASYTKAESDGKYQPKGGYVFNTRKVNGKSLSVDISLNANDVGTYSKNQTEDKFQLKNTVGKEERGWWKCSHTGIIYQWGKWKNPYKRNDINGRDGIPEGFNLIENFPISFPTVCTVVIPTVTNSDTREGICSPKIILHSFSKTQFTFQVAEYWGVVQSSSIYWFAVGY